MSDDYTSDPTPTTEEQAVSMACVCIDCESECDECEQKLTLVTLARGTA